MSQDDLLKWIKGRQPFQPIRLHVSNGEAFEVMHPDAIMVGKTSTVVMVDGHFHLIGNLHINHIEPLEPAAR